MNLRMRLHSVIAFLESLVGEFPVGGQNRRVPPIHLQSVGVARIHAVGDGAETFAQAWRIGVEVDESAACPVFGANRGQIDLRAFKQIVAEDFASEDVRAFAFGIPAPAVERANKPGRAAMPGPLGQPHTAVTAGILEALYAVFRVNHQHRMFQQIVNRIIADLRNFLQPASHLPDMRPQMRLFEFKKFWIVIALRRNQLGIGDLEWQLSFCLCDVVHCLPLCRAMPPAGTANRHGFAVDGRKQDASLIGLTGSGFRD
jgi:hypothetical protein